MQDGSDKGTANMGDDNEGGQSAEKAHTIRIPLPGGRVARIPLSVLEGFVVQDVKLAHDPSSGDVSAHNTSIDTATGFNVWHTDVELGPCEYTDENGYQHAAFAHHYHPFGTEYTEIVSV